MKRNYIFKLLPAAQRIYLDTVFIGDPMHAQCDMYMYKREPSSSLSSDLSEEENFRDFFLSPKEIIHYVALILLSSEKASQDTLNFE